MGMEARSFKLGVAPINWCNDDMPELGKDISLETCFSEMKEAGYMGTEIGHKYPNDPSQLKAMLGEYNLQLASCTHSTFYADKENHAKEHDRLKKRLEFLTEMGTKCINIVENTRSIHNEKSRPLCQKPYLSENEWEAVLQGMNEASRICNDFNIKLAYHHRMGTVIQNLDEITRIMDETKPELFHLCIDTGHLYYAGIDPIEVIEKYASRIVHVHLKDVRSEVLTTYSHQISYLDAVLHGVFTVPGDGCLEFEPIVSKILDSGYKGWLMVEAEQDPCKADPFMYARKGRKYLDQIVPKYA